MHCVPHERSRRQPLPERVALRRSPVPRRVRKPGAAMWDALSAAPRTSAAR